MTQERTDGEALFEAWMTLLGGVFLTADTLDGVGQASGFGLAWEWAKVVIGPVFLARGCYELWRLSVRPRLPRDE